MEGKKEVLAEGKFLKVLKVDTWEYVTRTNCSGIVVILPVTEDKKTIFVEQYRQAVESRVIEFPAGLVGDLHDKEESLETGAVRELEEETGYRPGKLVKIFEGPPSPGICSEIITIYGALELKKTGDGGGDHMESIKVHEVLLEAADQWLEDKSRETGIMIDPKVYAGLYMINKKLL